MKYFERMILKQEALFYMRKISIQQVELVVLKIYWNYKYLPWNRKKMKHAIALTSVTKVM